METLAEQLQQQVTRVLEDWAMMMVENADSPTTLFSEVDECLVASLEFRGPVSGVYKVVCPHSMAAALSSTLVGGDSTPSEAEMRDTVAEMVNVIGGNMLTTAYGEHVVFALTAPRVEAVAAADVGTQLSGTVLGFRADGEPLAVSFTPLEVTK